ncbi:MAG: DUF1464 family protein [Candidatus Methylarchaceae archaeon HK01B]|nr:DUF1464 family protein [Candidatus Methylarchaceae archaeon HK01B]
MVRVLGIDPGSKSFDFCGLDDGNVFIDKAIPSKYIIKDPKVAIELLRSVSPLDLIVGPSGYGLPLTHIDEVDDRRLFLMVLVRPDDSKKSATLGLRRILMMLKEESFNVYFIPGVIHMPTVPAHRKVNKIDMGTADKLCCSILGIFDQSRYFNIEYDETSFILVEVGYGYNAIIGVEKGQIVDGIGGTTGSIGFLSLGSMDGELAYLLNIFDKDILRQGGAAYIAGDEKVTPKEFGKRVLDNERYNLAWEAFMEGIEKGVAQMRVSVKRPREILLSGRLCRIKRIHDELSKRLSYLGIVRRVKGFAQVSKEAAQGATLLADGLAGGKYKGLVDTMMIREAKGTVLDYIHIRGIDELRQRYGV